jgi:hypothetical protein
MSIGFLLTFIVLMTSFQNKLFVFYFGSKSYKNSQNYLALKETLKIPIK